MKRISAFIFVFVLCVLVVAPASANQKEQVLGITIDSKDVNFPPVTAGPGLLLPDSPFYPLDNLKQKVKLMLAMGPRSKSLIHAQIAGERMAELRVMMERGNNSGIQTALSSLSYEMDQAVRDMNDAAAQGKDIKKLSEQLNEELKQHRKVLSSVYSQTNGELSLLILATNESLYGSKAEVEERLPEADRENETADAVMEQMDTAVLGISNARVRLETASDTLRKQSSRAAQRGLMEKKKRLETVQKNGDKTRIKIAEQEFEAEKKKQEEMLKSQEQALEKAKEAFEKAAESGKEYKTVKEILMKLRQKNIPTTQ